MAPCAESQALIEQLDREGRLTFCTPKKGRPCGCQSSGGCPLKPSIYLKKRSSQDQASDDVRILSGGWAVQEDSGAWSSVRARPFQNARQAMPV